MNEVEEMSPTDDSISADTVKAQGEFPVEACYAAGLEALNKGDLEGANAWAVRCEAASHGETDARCATLRGLIASEAGDLEAAASHLRQAVQLAPDDVSIARRLGEVLATGGTWSEAATTLERAAANSPGDIDLLVDLGYACMMSGDRAQARSALERAASLRPANAAVQYSLAQLYEALGEPALAASVLIPLTQHAVSPRLLSDLTLLLFRLERWNEAERYFIRLQQLDPDHYLSAQHGRIWCRIREQNWREAFDLALEATRIDRYDLTTALLDYVKDRLFDQVLDSARREAELGERIMAELLNHAELHADEHIADGTSIDKEAAHG